MASVLTDLRQKAVYMAPVSKQPRHKTGSMASGDNRGQKVPFGLAPICLDSRPEAKYGK